MFCRTIGVRLDKPGIIGKLTFLFIEMQMGSCMLNVLN